uniref:Uncharacterized protein n=1 Tax=Solanum lycopersicum TaxID=4081 RepID=A0A3Q7GT04_SOLLC
MNLPKRVKRYPMIQNEDLALSKWIGFHIFPSAFLFFYSWSYEPEYRQKLTRLPNSLELRSTLYHQLRIGSFLKRFRHSQTSSIL